MCDFIHTHCHSSYSFLDGATRIDSLLEAAKRMEMPAVALTDHGHMHGIPEFQALCEKKGLKAILGCEFYLVDSVERVRDEKDSKLAMSPYHQILIAKTDEGLENLHRLASFAATDGFYHKPLLGLAEMRAHATGVIATSSCISGLLSRSILGELKGNVQPAAGLSGFSPEEIVRFYMDTFGDDYYFEVHDHGIPEERVIREGIRRLTQVFDVRVICANDVHYVDKEDAALQSFLVEAKTGKSDYAHEGLHFSSPEEMKTLFAADFPESLENTLRLGESVTARLPFGRKFVLPNFPLPPPFSDERSYLEALCLQALPQRYAAEEILLAEARLREEIEMIDRLGFVRYFLIVSDITTAARRMDILVGPGRGSAAGSIVAYLTGITNIDPLRYELLFERFLNPERVSNPDIDLDFEDAKRPLVLDYIRRTYGEAHTSQIVTFQTFRAKAALREIARMTGAFSPAEIDRLSKHVEDTDEEIRFDDEKVADTFFAHPMGASVHQKASKVIGFKRTTSVHPAAVVITPGDISDYVPVVRIKQIKKSVVVSQYDGGFIDQLGLLKMDILGLRTLSIQREALEMIEENHGKKIDLDRIPLDDDLTFGLYRRGGTDGIFQFESDGMKRYLVELEPSSIEDLIAMNALYRPGPMEQIPVYIRRKHGKERVSYPHPSIEAVLKPTYGIPVYQEQVMQIARLLAGYTLGAADNLRRVVSKKKAEEMEKERANFLGGCSAQGVSRETAAAVFDLIEKFAAYGFNRSHAAAYSVLSYQSAYLKAHYPTEFMAATLEHEARKDTEKKRFFLEVCRAMNIEVLPPSVEKSASRFYGEHGKIYYGMSAVKNVREAAVEEIARERKQRPYANFEDFILRHFRGTSALTSQVVENLILVGAFDGFIESPEARPDLLEQVGPLIAWARLLRAYDEGTRKSLPQRPNFTLSGRKMGLDERLKYELELLGQFVSGHPMQGYEPLQSLFGADPLEIGLRNPVRLFAGFVTKVEHRKTRKGDPMATLELLTGEDAYEMVAFKETLRRFGGHLESPYRRLVVVATMGYRGDFIVEAIATLEEVLADWPFALMLEARADLGSLLEVLSHIPGERETVILHEGKAFEGPPVTLSPLRLKKVGEKARIEFF